LLLTAAVPVVALEKEKSKVKRIWQEIEDTINAKNREIVQLKVCLLAITSPSPLSISSDSDHRK